MTTENTELAFRAAEAGAFAAKALRDHGLGSREAGEALAEAERISDKAVALGVTPEEIKAARRRLPKYGGTWGDSA
ncbi:hypothetical protein ACFCZ1_26840 [Streptomyces sp. NPDC056224]|uniref:hypothetical protein n=1 Tax=Streptomyces sp. NPDC056224 TaxID=3345750 RepID=UPI0035DE9AC8